MSNLHIPVGYGQATLHFTVDTSSKFMSTAFGYRINDEDDPLLHASNIAGFFSNTGGLLAQAVVLQGWNFTEVSVIEPVESGPPHIASFHPTISGTGGTNPLPTNCAELFRKRTNRGGAENRGRAYFPALHVTESDVNSNGIIDDDVLEIIQGFAAATMGDWLASDIPPVLLHSNPATLPTVMNALILEEQIATQRRRMR